MNGKLLLLSLVLVCSPLAAKADGSDALDKRIEAKTLNKNLAANGVGVKNNDPSLHKAGQADPLEPKLKRKSAKQRRK